MAGTPKDTEGMTEYKSRPIQRRLVRKYMGRIKLGASHVPAPEAITLPYHDFCELVRYAESLDRICHSEKVIGKSYSDDWPATPTDPDTQQEQGDG